ncbi:MAG: HNH endonuclease [Verrucomicrobia bacterium]|nr:HNH endonuclease [Cytophagales bacterium]
MMKLNSKSLPSAITTQLNSKQQKIDDLIGFEQQAKKAKSLWENKIGSKKGKAAFAAVKNTLIGMCVSVEICNYCEGNEATDIEHIFPKSHFPDKTFVWENYLLACKQCNTTYKRDKFAIFDRDTSVEIIELNFKNHSLTPPYSSNAAFINPRKENPLEYLWLDIKNTFLFVVIPTLSERDKQKAVFTLKTLGLNIREALVKARRSAAQYYYDRLESYVRIKEATDSDTVQGYLPDFIRWDKNELFDEEKRRIMVNIQKDIQIHPHPTVWAEMKRQRSTLAQIRMLFERAPEALEW